MSSYSSLDEYRKARNKPHCSYLVIDNFLNNPDETRKYILTQDFTVTGNYPGKRTISYATEEMKNLIQKFLEPHAGKITQFKIGHDAQNENYNGAFQYTTSRDRSWIHTDGVNNWAGVLYLTPDAPSSAGTGLFKHKSTGIVTQDEMHLMDKAKLLGSHSQDYTKWELTDVIGNKYNRLILFDARQHHASLDYFGTTKEDGRLFQTFFFSTEI